MLRTSEALSCPQTSHPDLTNERPPRSLLLLPLGIADVLTQFDRAGLLSAAAQAGHAPESEEARNHGKVL